MQRHARPPPLPGASSRSPSGYRPVAHQAESGRPTRLGGEPDLLDRDPQTLCRSADGVKRDRPRQFPRRSSSETARERTCSARDCPARESEFLLRLLPQGAQAHLQQESRRAPRDEGRIRCKTLTRSTTTLAPAPTASRFAFELRSVLRSEE